MDKFGDNAFQLEFPSYMKICSIFNVENLKLYEPPMIVDQDVQIQVPSMDEFAIEYLNEL